VATPTLPDLSIRQLEYLVAVADAPTWAVAASHVGVSPSALSQGLAELERRVGVELFEPHGRRRVLRSSATPVLDHARQVVGLTRDLVEWSDRVRTARTGRVRLGMVDVAAVVHFPAVVRSFRTERPAVELTLSVAPSAALLDDLRDGVLDLVVCVEPPGERAGIEMVPLLSEPLAVLAPPGVTIGAPASWGPWLLFPSGSHTRHLVAEHLREIGVPIRVAAESHQPDVLLQMVALGLGWTVLPVDPAVVDDHATIGPELMRRQLVLATRSGALHDPAVDELAAQLRSA
jgi:DNA-binding transcriptional LysR family regulator